MGGSSRVTKPATVSSSASMSASVSASHFPLGLHEIILVVMIGAATVNERYFPGAFDNCVAGDSANALEVVGDFAVILVSHIDKLT